MRSDPLQFIVAAGHEMTTIEDVVRRTEHYVVVRKHPDVLEKAAEAEPSSAGSADRPRSRDES